MLIDEQPTVWVAKYLGETTLQDGHIEELVLITNPDTADTYAEQGEWEVVRYDAKRT